MNIILIGMPGAGKSTVGVVMAKIRGMQFIDTDLLLQQQTGVLLQELIDQKGKDAFLDLEAETICQVKDCNAIVAPGGSVIGRPESIKHLKETGIVVYLEIAFEELVKRLGDVSARGITIERDQTLLSLYHERVPLYRKYADITVNCSGNLRIEDTALKVIREINDYELSHHLL